MRNVLLMFILFSTLHYANAHSRDIEQVVFEPDNNGNYVRDDIEDLIHNKFPNDPQLAEFLLDYVRIDQALIQNYQNKDMVLSSSKKKIAMESCLESSRPDFDSKFLKVLFSNVRSTMNISLAYIESTKHFGGSVIEGPSDGEVASVCQNYFQ